MNVDIDYSNGGEEIYNIFFEHKKCIISTLMLSINVIFYMYKRPTLYKYFDRINGLKELMQDYDQLRITTENEYEELFGEEFNYIEFISKEEIEAKILHFTTIAEYYELPTLTYGFAAISLVTFFYSDKEIEEFISEKYYEARDFLTEVIVFIY